MNILVLYMTIAIISQPSLFWDYGLNWIVKERTQIYSNIMLARIIKGADIPFLLPFSYSIPSSKRVIAVDISWKGKNNQATGTDSERLSNKEGSNGEMK